GGLTASRAGFPQLAGGVVEGGLSGVLFAADVAVATGLSQGCSPIGPPHAITEANQNIVARIDDRPALEVLIEDVTASGGGAEPVMAALPVPGSDTADYLVRNLIGADRERGCVAIAEAMEVGQPILFVRRNRAAAVKDLERMLDRLARRVGGSSASAVKGGVYVSCLARGPNLFRPHAPEL